MTEQIPYKGERVDLKTASQILGLSVSGVRLWIEQGKLEKAESNSNKVFVYITDEMRQNAEGRIQDKEQRADDPSPARPDPVTTDLVEKITSFMDGALADKTKLAEEYRVRAERFEQQCEDLKAQVETIPLKIAEIVSLQDKLILRDEQIAAGKKRLSELEDSRDEFKRHAIRARNEKRVFEKQSRAGWGVAAAATVLFLLLTGFTVYSGYIAPQKAVSGFAAMSPASGP